VGPLLAQSVDVSKDGLTYTFRLRKGVKFHNDAPLTSAEVAWSWKRYMDPKTDWRCLSEYDGRNGLKVAEATTPDDATFVLKINRPSAVFLDMLARSDCGMTAILHPSSVKADGSWDKPVGTGPFKFGEWKRGEYVTVTAFKGYTSSPGATKADGYVGLKAPLVDTVRFLVVPDAATAAAGLKSGAIDAGQITSSDAQELKAARNLVVQAPTEAVKNTLLFQTRDPLLKNAPGDRGLARHGANRRGCLRRAGFGQQLGDPQGLGLLRCGAKEGISLRSRAGRETAARSRLQEREDHHPDQQARARAELHRGRAGAGHDAVRGHQRADRSARMGHAAGSLQQRQLPDEFVQLLLAP
jgi:hypothetical protein